MNMGNILLLVFPLLLCALLFYGAKLNGEGEFNEGVLSLNQMKILQAFSCLGVILHHITQNLTGYGSSDIGPMTLLADMGILFTSVFFFSSGYGLIYSYENKPNYLDSFLKRRLPSVIVPFVTANILYIAYNSFTGTHYSIGRFLNYAFGLTLINSNGWFIIEIIFFYLAFYVIFLLLKKESVGIFLMGIFSIGIIQYSKSNGHGEGLLPGDMKANWFVGEWWYNTTILFLFGMLVAKFKSQLLCFAKTHYKKLMIGVTIAFLICSYVERLARMRVGYYSQSNHFSFISNSTITLIVQIVLCTLWMALLILINLKVEFGNRLIEFVGIVSVEVFLLHHLFMTLFYNTYIHMPFIGIPLIIVCSVVASFILHKINGLIIGLFGKIPEFRIKLPKKFWATIFVIGFLVLFGFVFKDKIFAGFQYRSEMDKISSAQIGDVVEYGHFDVDSGIGNERLTWIVVDKQEGKVTLLAQQVIGSVSYHNKHEEVNWTQCKLREIINSPEYLCIFNQYEIQALEEDENENVMRLMTKEEAESFFSEPEDRKAAATDTAVASGVNVNDMSKVNNWDYKKIKSSWYWLKQSGEEVSIMTPVIDVDGNIIEDKTEVSKASGGLRPMITVMTGSKKTVDNMSYRFKDLIKTEASGTVSEENLDKIIIQYTTNVEEGKSLCIDVAGKKIYEGIYAQAADMSQPTSELTDEQVALLVKIYSEYVEDWKNDYATKEKIDDGYSWVVVISDTLGNVARSGGSGSAKEKCTPDNFDDFIEEVNNAIEE